MVPAVILAAGRSLRMGRPKPLLITRDGQSFVRQLSQTLWAGGVAEVLVVGRPDDAALRAEVETVGVPARFVENPDADTAGQISSIVAGLRVADRPGVRAVLVTPVDLPLVTTETVRTLLSSFNSTGAQIVRPVHGGGHGHPVIFARALFAELRAADVSRGAIAVLRAHEGAILNVEVADPGVLTDVDTPEDYQRLFGRPPG